MAEPKKEYNKTDPVIKRATFGVNYPITDLEITKVNKIDDFESISVEGGGKKRFIREIRLDFEKLDNCSLKSLVFERSEFHHTHGDRPSEVTLISFVDCDFKETFMGGTIYKRVIFRRCSFNKCDFMDAEFIECRFENCIFENCTAFRTIFTETLIDPKAIYENIPVPEYNFSSVEESKIKEIKREWIDVKLALGQQLLKTSSQVFNTNNIDESSYILKKAEFSKTLDKISHPKEYLKNINGVTPRSLKTTWYILTNSLNLIVSGVTLLITRGGTSFQRLIITGFILTLIISFHLSRMDICYGETSLKFSGNGFLQFLKHIISNIPYSISLLFGFGFSAFSFVKSLAWNIVSYALIGVAWYALLLHIIVRKVYR